jgi:hypothetical protein
LDEDFGYEAGKTILNFFMIDDGMSANYYVTSNLTGFDSIYTFASLVKK